MNSKISTKAVCILVVMFCFSSVSMAYDLYCDYFNAYFDDAGYSDVINWGYSPNHPYPYQGGFHETLSGEWGAAIFYNGLSTEPNSMWLSNYFKFPYWYTNSTFSTSLYLNSWDDPNNPVQGYDTAQSKIVSGDGKVEITIDYEIVDLGDGNWSPLAIRDKDGNIGFVKSDQFLFLQTYTIKNLQNDANITGLELYQMVHSHGADDYGPVVNVSYTNANYSDPLANYAPYNPVHTIGNFHFDVTQWNEPNDPNADPQSEPHQDWVGFSSTAEPDVYECNIYPTDNGDYGKPTKGTHIHIEKRNLNNVNYSYGETAGAMGWYLPDLAPGQSTSITVAFMFGCGPIDYNTPPMPDCSLFDISPNPPDGIVNFLDFAVLANAWLTSLGNDNYNDNVDFVNNNSIDVHDLKAFCDCWLWPYAGEGSGGEMMAMQQPEQEADEMMMELPEDEQQSMMAGEGETAAVYLISDVNMPNSGDEVTVQIYSDTPLFCMGLIITVTGDANITGAVSTADCNEYGWDPDWPTDPYIDPEGWLYVSGVSWEGQAEGVVGYLKFLYNSGEVSVCIMEGDAYDPDCEPVLISGESLTFGESE